MLSMLSLLPCGGQNLERFNGQMKGLVGVSSQELIIQRGMMASLSCGVCTGRGGMPCVV